MSAKKKVKGAWSVLKPKSMKNGGWMVSLGMVDGKNVRRKFKTKDAAQEFCNTENETKKKDSKMPVGADGALVAEWMAMDAELKEAGVDSLLAAGRRVLKDAKAVKQTGSAKQCFDACHTALTGKRRGKYLADLRNRCGRFMRYFGQNRPVLEITPEVIEAYLKTLKNTGDFKTISAWLGWAARNRWLPSNPCQGLKPEETPQANVVILSTVESSRMLKAAVLSENWDVLATVAISLFAGLRPEEFRKRAKGEAPADLLWDDVKDGHLSIRPELCKNGRRSGKGRTVLIEPVLKDWIDFIRVKKGGILSGRIQPSNWKKIWESWRHDHWLDADKKPRPWGKDQLRHTFGSYHLARGKNLGETSFIMENSPKVLKKHYWNWETLGSQAAMYWALTPTQVLETPKRDSASRTNSIAGKEPIVEAL
jgi:hypothetical protein